MASSELSGKPADGDAFGWTLEPTIESADDGSGPLETSFPFSLALDVVSTGVSGVSVGWRLV